MIIVEDGTGKTNANSFVSVDYADNYFTARYSAWEDLSDDEKETALIKATDFINASFKWRGKKASYEQALSFPRINCVDDDGYTVVSVPNAVKAAVCEAVIIGNDLFNKAENNGAVTSEKIGSIAYTYDVSKKQKDVTLYDSINLRLKGLYIDTNKSQVLAIKVARV